MSVFPLSPYHRLSRRTFLAGSVSSLLLGRAGLSHALGRTPHGGRFSLHLPWPTRSLDPHDLRDPAASLFASAIADSLYTLDASGHPAPALAAALPSREALGTVIRLRENLRTARKVAMDARDVLFSLDRARSRGAAALFADLPKAEAYPKDPLALVFGKADPQKLARAFSSPLTAIVPRHFDPLSPDGTGPFRADCGDKSITFSRNSFAACGASFLDGIDVFRADDLATSLRRFEAERDDIGWLGLGLHGERAGAARFDLGSVAWIVLWIGSQAPNGFGLPGVAQRLLDGVPPERLSHVGLGLLPAAVGDAAWGGLPAEMLVDEDSPHLLEIGRTLAPILSRPGHEVTLTKSSRGEIARKRASKQALMSLEIVRPLYPGALGALLALATADDAALARDLAKAPPKLPMQASARTLTRSLHVGVLGEVRISGGAVPELVLARGNEGWDLGASFLRRRGK